MAEWLFKDNLSYKEIKERLKLEFDLEVSEVTIMNYKRLIIDSVPEFLEHDKEYREKLAKTYLDTVENLVFLLNEIYDKIKEFKDPSRWRQHSTYLNLALQECHMLLKRTGEIKPNQFIKQEINMIQINQIVQTEIVRWIDDGLIPLETCADSIKEFYKKHKKVIPNENLG